MRTPLSNRMTKTLVAVVLGSTALTACSSSEASGGRRDGDTTVLTWQMWSGSEAETAALTKLSELVTQKYPNIKLETQTSTFGDYWTKLATQASGGQVGCILGVQAPRAASIESLMVPLTQEKLTGAGINLAELDPAIVSATQVNGKQLAVPYDLGPYVLYYNKDLLAAGGVAEPTAAGWTADEFKANAQTLTKNGKFGISVFPSTDQLSAWGQALTGAQLVGDDGKLNLTDPKVVETVEFLQDLTTSKIAPQLPATNDADYSLNQFISGNTAMTADGPWQLANLQKQAGFDVGITTLPAGPGGTSTIVNGSGYGISNSCSFQDEALKALSVLTGPDVATYLAESGRAFPARTAQQDLWFQGDLATARDAMTAATQSAKGLRATKNWTQVSQSIAQFGVPALNGQQTATDYLSAVQQQVGSGQ